MISSRLSFVVAAALSVAISSSPANADDAKCSAFVDFLRESYMIDTLSCADLSTVRGFQLANPGVRKMTLKQRTYAVELLTHLNTNKFVCGRDREIMRYTGSFGETKTTDIATDVFIKKNLVQPDLLLPIPPSSLVSVESLTELFGKYLDASESPETDPKKVLYGMAKAREAFWADGMKAMLKDENCAAVFCKATGTDLAQDKSCEKKIAKLKPDEFLTRLTTVVRSDTPAATTVSGATGNKPDADANAGASTGATSGRQSQDRKISGQGK